MTKFFYDCKCGHGFSHFEDDPSEKVRKECEIAKCPECGTVNILVTTLPRKSNMLIRSQVESGDFKGRYYERS